MKFTTKITGVDEVDDLLSKVAPRHAKNIMRATVHGMAGEIRDEAKKIMPVDEGTMKKVTKSKRRRQRGSRIASAVVVGKEAFYWRYLEYGSGPDGVEHAMFFKAVQKFRGEMDALLKRQFLKKFIAALERARKRQG